MEKIRVIVFFLFVFLITKEAAASEKVTEADLNFSLLLSSKYDYENGYFDSNVPKMIKFEGQGDVNHLFDNHFISSRTVSVLSNSPIEIVLDKAVNIDAFFHQIYNYPGFISFLDDERNLIIKYDAKVNSSGLYSEMKIMGIKYILLQTVSGGSPTMYGEFEIFEGKDNVLVPVNNLTEKHTHESVDLSWINPTGEKFKKVIVKKNGAKVEELDKPLQKYSFSGLDPATEYVFEVVAMYEDGRLSNAVSIIVNTSAAPKPVGDVIGLTADADYDRVDLSWQLPQNDNLKHVNIYRDTLNKTLLDKILGVKSVFAATKIFETNGTYFNDLTVSDDTKYEYLLTTTSTDKIESDGVSITVLTPKKPKLEIGDAEYDVDENGDFIFTWQSPVTGKVKVVVGGSVYATVDAVDKQIVISKNSMKYKFDGAPNVQLIAVDLDGNESTPTIPPPATGVESSKVIKIPFKSNDVLNTAFGFIGVLSGLILLAIAIHLLPRLIKIIKGAVLSRKGG